MTAATLTSNRGSGSLKALILLALVIMLASVSLHALEKHGEKAIIASQCQDRPELRMTNPQTGRIAFICLTEAGWGVAITESNGNPVTSFLKDRVKRIDQVVQYLKNSGYELQ